MWSVLTRDVNRSSKISDRRKSLSSYFGLRSVIILSWTIFWTGHCLTHFLRCRHMEHNSVNSTAMCVPLSVQQWIKENHVCRKQFINIVTTIWTILGRQNYLDIFVRHFLLALDIGLDKIWEMSESYTTSDVPDLVRVDTDFGAHCPHLVHIDPDLVCVLTLIWPVMVLI